MTWAEQLRFGSDCRPRYAVDCERCFWPAVWKRNQVQSQPFEGLSDILFVNYVQLCESGYS